MSTTFSQQIISSMLLRVVIDEQKSNFIGKFKIRTNNNLPHMLCFESVVKNVMDVAFFFFNNTLIFCYDWFQYDILLFYFGL